MARRNRIRRKLTLSVTEAVRGDPNETWTPGARFAQGWAIFGNRIGLAEGIERCAADPIQIAGYLAAKAAWDAHHYATNWMEFASDEAIPDEVSP